MGGLLDQHECPIWVSTGVHESSNSNPRLNCECRELPRRIDTEDIDSVYLPVYVLTCAPFAFTWCASIHPSMQICMHDNTLSIVTIVYSLLSILLIVTYVFSFFVGPCNHVLRVNPRSIESCSLTPPQSPLQVPSSWSPPAVQQSSIGVDGLKVRIQCKTGIGEQI